MRFFVVYLLFSPQLIFGQNFTSYFTGNPTDLVVSPIGGICLMGGATEDDNAMKWFLQRANGGDVLVLRASGSNGYNDYLYTDLGIAINSVETIVCNNAAASSDPYLVQKIGNAEAIWFAGGDQWDYISYWRNSPVDSAINEAIENRAMVIGGTSAGMAIQGKYYFSAQNGTVTSATALANPFNNFITVDSTSFIRNEYLGDVITDSHFDNPDRKGRLVTFMARIQTNYGVMAKGIACDEYTAVCIDTNGIAKVFAGYPTYDEKAYFIQSNCELANQLPENCSNGNPLTWNLGSEAIKVYRVHGTATGANTFDLNDWETGMGGTWLDWSVTNGTFLEQSGTQINCNSVANLNELNSSGNFTLAPNPAREKVIITLSNDNATSVSFKIFDVSGQSMLFEMNYLSENEVEIDLSELNQGVYFIRVESDNGLISSGKVIKN